MIAVCRISGGGNSCTAAEPSLILLFLSLYCDSVGLFEYYGIII